MRIFALLAALISLFYLETSLAGVFDFHCSSKSFNNTNVKYCINDVNRTVNEDVVYFFHGISASEKSWFKKNDTRSIAKEWVRNGYEPTVITISLGPVWMLVENQKHQYLSLFRDQILPYLEDQIGGLRQGRRLIIGQSMGGFNAAQASFKIPGLFERVVLLCPAITVVGPYSTPQEISDYKRRTRAEGLLVDSLVGISKRYIIDLRDWDEHNVLNLPARYPMGFLKPLYYVSTGRGDNFGFQEGSELFANAANKTGFQAQSVPVFGYHCSFNLKGVSNFIRGVSQ
ncbi:alpha/beta hydrolase-fold protein [Bdellovibrio sp. HCB274]|uniref:alpha/beta hydrolase-fold protein n=1 Tax=Bdellovibrio sp. HCB274 TaxID=3394361 RepID=UPI0039B3D1C1